jgi:hypothetical protein
MQSCVNDGCRGAVPTGKPQRFSTAIMFGG